MVDYLRSFTIITCISLLAYMIFRLNYQKIRLSELFVARQNRINQDISKNGKIYLREIRNRNTKNSITVKSYKFAKYLKKDLESAFSNIQINKIYKIRTHLDLKYYSNQYHFELISTKKWKTRLLIEAISFLGLNDFICVCLKKEKRKMIVKEFYKYSIRRTE